MVDVGHFDHIFKILLIGDAGVGKTSFVHWVKERAFNAMTQPTIGCSFVSHTLELPQNIRENTKLSAITLNIWDTAGQERFNKMHPAYYHRAHACILCFDVTRKATYQHLGAWYDEMRDACENIPCILVANKIDIDYQVTRKNFKFASSKNIPFYFVSAADGTNVVKVFRAAVESALDYKDNSGDFMNEAYKLLDDA